MTRIDVIVALVLIIAVDVVVDIVVVGETIIIITNIGVIMIVT